MNGTSETIRFPACRRRRVEASFDGDAVTSDAGALLLREADRRLVLIAALLRRLAYVLIAAIRRLGLAGTEMARAQVATIRRYLFKIGAADLRNTRRVCFLLSSACPNQGLFHLVAARLKPG